MNKIFIYGAGVYGKSLLKLLKELGIIVKGFIVSNKEIDSYCEIQGYSYNEVKDQLNDSTLFIAIQNEAISSKIKRTLKKDGVCARVIDGKSFVDDNRFTKYNLNPAMHICNICGNYVDEFAPAGIVNDLFKKHHIIGSGYRKNCTCPYCGSIDRNRWLLYVLENYTSMFSLKSQEGIRVLHFAPEIVISKFLYMNAKIDYYSGDIKYGEAMHITDITNIEQYADGTFDYIICNHVLEHIVNIDSAVNELKRVLKNRGKLIFSFPICTDMPTIEDKNVNDNKERLEKYGQEDHVRLYGNDYLEIYERYGLNIKEYIPEKCVDAEIIEKYSFIKDDIIMIAEKR